MLYIAVDLGTYSLKFLRFRIEKKKLFLESSDEITIDVPKNSEEEENSLWNAQLLTLNEYLTQFSEDYQLIMNFKSDLVSTRFLQIPGKNKKRALMMLPFQIEEDFPFSLADCHYAESTEVLDENCNVVAGIIKKTSFEEFYFSLKSHNLSPRVLTYSVSIYEQFIKNNADMFPESFCLLEMGHSGTRGFYFQDGRLISNHTSYVGGLSLTESIAKTYNISIDEAAIYKHQNGFVLTKDQYDQVDKSQKDFATMMDSNLEGLLNEIRRWEIGYRVKNGDTATKYLICGGAANIKNMKNYLQHNLGTEVEFFDAYINCADQKIDKEKKYRSKFAHVTSMAEAMKSKSKVINFVRGNYSLHAGSELPTGSYAFIGTRLLCVALFICSILMFDQFMVSKDFKAASKQMGVLLKNKTFNLSPREVRVISKKKPQSILSKLKRQQKQIKQEIKVIQSSVKINALKSLEDISSALTGYDVEVVEFYSQDKDDFKLKVKAKDLTVLKKLEKHLTEDSEMFVEVNAADLTLSLSGEEK